MALFFFAITTVSFAQKQPESLKGPSVASAVPFDVGSPADYVGVEKCKSCHKSETTEFLKTTHSQLTIPGKDFIQGCEACHGPGKAHSDAVQAAHGDDADTAKALKEHPMFSFRASATENAARCLACHITSKGQQFFAHSGHFGHSGHGISCNQCHAAHLTEEVKDASKNGLSYPQGYFFQLPQLPDENRWLRNSLLKQSEPALCFTCHLNVQAQFALPVHHRVPEGLLKCSDCHNPHETLNFASLRGPGNQTCTYCHIEKHGPFVFEHPSVSVTGCTTCHNPHGTSNVHLLVRREGRQLCLQCHTGFHFSSQPGVPHSRLSYQTSGECTRCHVTIHGSNLDTNFLR
jgi:predicted CXXCH cytochrome family protein